MRAHPLNPSESAPFGPAGVHVETGVTQVKGNFIAIQVLADATFSEFTENSNPDATNASTADAMTGFAITAGTILYNALGITSFTLSTGKVRAYRG